MWLINTTTYEVCMFAGSNVPPYAILSHTWGPDEVTFQDIRNLALASTKAGFTKIQGCCVQALRHNIDWAWIDSCCIDKTSSAELSEAINSMYSYYLLSRVCFVYLADVPPLTSSLPMGQLPSLASSRWFTRGWTLQELIAPPRSIFYASDWSRLGTKGLHSAERPFIQALASITGIFESVLAKSRHPRDYSVAERMSWAAARQTTRDEDLAYCLMGLFGVNVPVLYGEGLAGAFRRLQHEIIATSPDETIFAWRADPTREVVDPYTGERRRRAVGSSGLLADSPADFARSRDVHQRALHSASPFRLFSMTNMGLSIVADLVPLTGGSARGSPAPQAAPDPRPLVVMPIGASDRPTDTSPRTRVGIYLEPVLQASSTGHRQTFYRRVRCDEFCFAPKGEFPKGEELDIYVLGDNQFAEMQFADRPGSPGPGGWSPSIGARLSLSPSASPRPSPRASPRLGMDL
ncbi:vegetative incompatibility protein HET-E-1 [Colletotrichum spaethianum]|uniref:Vegetative incompatibility protein HET-E-1 n=1 Tax=Colletotrichum spaethianum TaxID=700344 RepID=A0AA37LBK3_9PEZI|nr:vegetative incompatibility protein HET-E-1 [Colletotrichum spaethianum]GKT45467.1 vegetative incompatibility protein HET-E-1 [Colletotrichum spaethianum]